MNIKKYKSIIYKAIIVVLSITIPMYLIGYYILITLGAEILEKLIK